MMNAKNVARVLAKPSGLGCVALVTVAFIAGCASFSPCKNSVLQKAPSPDGKYQALVFLRDCGATTAFSTQVSVLPSGASLPGDGGNVFISGERSTATSGVRARWLSASRLKIFYDARAQRFKKIERFNGIAIVYATR